MEFHLDLGLSSNPRAKSHFHMKRSLSQFLEEHASDTEATFPPTLSLLPLTPTHPNRHDNEHHSHCSSTITTCDDGEALVGWPPVNYWRKKLRYGDDDNHHHHHHHHTRSNTLYVKVKMEGVGIARKVDLTMHHSFQTLKQTLMVMFGKCQEQLNSYDYELAYQDKEGDWLLAEDVSWRSFIQCALRLKLLKTRT